MLLLKFANALINFRQSHCVGIPHRTAAVGGESVTVEINDVDVDGAECVALFENSRAFVDERIGAAIDDLIGGDLALRDTCLRAPLSD